MRSFKKASLVLAAALLACGGSWAQTKYKAWNIHPDGYPVTEAMKSFAAEVEKATSGRHVIEVHSNGVLGDQPKAVQMLKSGEIELAEFSLAPLSEAAPGIKALNLPFLFTDSKHMFSLLDGPLGQRFEERLKASGYVVLGWYDGGARSFYCTSAKLASVSDFKDLKIRVQQSDVYFQMIKDLDAQPVSVPYKEVLGALEGGQVQCAENNLPSFVSAGHYKVARNVYLSNHVISPEALVISSRVWDKLDRRDQQAFMVAGRKSAQLMRALWDRKVEESREIAVKAGVQFTRVRDFSPLVRRMKGLHGKYLADPQTREELLSILASGQGARVAP
jgi:tripartite ATP-independent transporter DctP family solute receptor